MQAAIARTIKTFVRDDACDAIRDEPLVGFAAADDPLMTVLKTAVSSSHALPQDLLPDARSVVVYYLPFRHRIPRSNRHERLASREWARAYIETNRLIIAINEHLAEKLQRNGYRTVLLPPTHNFDTERLISDWSHKHMAYIAGLGNFGVHHLLITPKGCCGRFGSLVTNVSVQPSTRSGREACLYRFNGSCLKCIDRCVVKALALAHFDRQRCYHVLLENAERYKKEGLADVCGKCTCVVPCSFSDPVMQMSADQPGKKTQADTGMQRKKDL